MCGLFLVDGYEHLGPGGRLSALSIPVVHQAGSLPWLILLRSESIDVVIVEACFKELTDGLVSAVLRGRTTCRSLTTSDICVGIPRSVDIIPSTRTANMLGLVEISSVESVPITVRNQ
jgi:hypothetical protein